MEFDPILDVPQLSTLLKIHPCTTRKLARNGEIPGFQIGSAWRFRLSEIDEWLRAKSRSRNAKNANS